MPLPQLQTGSLGAAMGAAAGAFDGSLDAAAGAPTGTSSLPWSGLEATGGVSGLDGSILFWNVGPDGKRKGMVSQEEMRRALEQRVKSGQIKPEDAFRQLQRMGFTGGGYSDGKLIIGSFNGQSSSGRAVQGDAEGRPVSGAQGGSQSSSGGRGSVSLGGGGGGGGGGGASASRSQGYNAGAPAAPGPVRNTQTDVSAGTGGPGLGPTSINPNAALGLDPRRAPGGGVQGGDPRFRSGTLPGPGSLLDGITPQTTLNDLSMGIVRRQEANRDASLGIYGGAIDEHGSNPLLQASRQRGLDVLANPFSLDDQTVSRMMGQQGDLIGQNLGRMQQTNADRAAASGMGRSGTVQANNDRLGINAVKELGNAQRGLLVEQATRRPKELQASLQSAGDFGQRDFAQGADLATRAADNVYGQTSIMGDALLSGVLMGGGQPQAYTTTGMMNQGNYTPVRTPIY